MREQLSALCLFHQIFPQERWQHLPLVRALQGGRTNHVWDTQHCPGELPEGPLEGAGDCPSQKLQSLRQTLPWPPSQFERGFMNQPRQKVLTFCDLTGTSLLCLLLSCLRKTPHFALSLCSSEPLVNHSHTKCCSSM